MRGIRPSFISQSLAAAARSFEPKPMVRKLPTLGSGLRPSLAVSGESHGSEMSLLVRLASVWAMSSMAAMPAICAARLTLNGWRRRPITSVTVAEAYIQPSLRHEERFFVCRGRIWPQWGGAAQILDDNLARLAL